MKKFLIAGVLGLMAAMGAPAGALAAEATPAPPPLPPPFQGEKPLGLTLYVDTVVSGKAVVAQKEPLAGCAQTSIIHLGQTIVFRMWGTDNQLGGVPVNEDIVEAGKAYVRIGNVMVAGVQTTVRIPLAWGSHSASKATPALEANKHSYWTVGVPTKGEAGPGWLAETAPGVTSPIAEKTKIEIPPTPSGSSLPFTVYVSTKAVTISKKIKVKVKAKKGKKGKKSKTQFKTVVKKTTEPGAAGEFSQVNFPVSSQLQILP